MLWPSNGCGSCNIRKARARSTLHVPVGRDIKLIMTSQDAIHSFFIPAFRVKQDVLPGRYTTVWFHPSKAGAYHLFCSQYCGTSHSGMIGDIMVMEPVQYEAWLSGGTTVPLADAKDGRTLTADENYLRQCILNSREQVVKGFPPIMPVFQGLLSEEQVNALVAYIKSLGAPPPGQATKNPSEAALQEPQESKVQ